MPRLEERVTLALGTAELKELKNAARFRGANLQQYIRRVVMASVKDDLAEKKAQAPRRPHPGVSAHGLGVRWDANRGRFRVVLSHPLVTGIEPITAELYLGSFRSQEAATAARDAAQEALAKVPWYKYTRAGCPLQGSTSEQEDARKARYEEHEAALQEVRDLAKAVGKMFEPD